MRGRGLCIASFSLVDPLIVTDYSGDFVIVRVGLILCLFAVLAVSHLNVSNTAIQHLGGAACVITGMGVTVLTEMTGGASVRIGPIMLTYFGTALILSDRRMGCHYLPWSRSFTSGWLILNDTTMDPGSWAGSQAGIWLALVVSVLGVRYVQYMRGVIEKTV